MQPMMQQIDSLMLEGIAAAHGGFSVRQCLSRLAGASVLHGRKSFARDGSCRSKDGRGNVRGLVAAEWERKDPSEWALAAQGESLNGHGASPFAGQQGTYGFNDMEAHAERRAPQRSAAQHAEHATANPTR
ncbi:hypothetical protein AC579_9372 [Pseudocercospora musae]|uniref:Uncharacterized protein n=1 Tax=Pseudocercospora musae TaxID=113226 RepID=A0A139GT32_9PEZI|nr:hypothetical protein AC579_9372 [Pseudocercospora musae]